MSFSFDHLRQPDGWYLDGEGVSHQSAEDYLCHQLEFCGCGQPKTALEHVRIVLQFIADLMARWELPRDTPMPIAPFTDGIMYFTYYRLDDLKLIEHGGSVPGWLTKEGETLLADLTELKLHEKP